MIRRLVTWFTVGVTLGLVASMWFGPQMITWWSAPPGAQNGFSCSSQIEAATRQLVKLQLGVGATLGFLLAIIANVVAGRRTRSATQPPAPTPGARTA